jgi:hypothetical protein
LSAFHPLSGWTDADEVRAPEGTAFTRWAVVPRLTGAGGGIYAALATLSVEAVPLAAEVTEVTDSTIKVRWATGAVTSVAFDPLTVDHRAH